MGDENINGARERCQEIQRSIDDLQAEIQTTEDTIQQYRAKENHASLVKKEETMLENRLTSVLASPSFVELQGILHGTYFLKLIFMV